MKSIAIILLILFSTFAFSSGKPYGIWKFQSTLVFIEILETGKVFQCRIDTDGSAITAHGKYDGISKIIWEPVKVVDKNKNPVEIDFSWQEDEITVIRNAIALSGPYGVFSFSATNEKLPTLCR